MLNCTQNACIPHVSSPVNASRIYIDHCFEKKSLRSKSKFYAWRRIYEVSLVVLPTTKCTCITGGILRFCAQWHLAFQTQTCQRDVWGAGPDGGTTGSPR